MHHTSQLISTKAQRFLIFIKKSLKGFVKLYLFWRFDDVKTLCIGPIRFLSASIHYLPDGLLRFPKIPYLFADFLRFYQINLQTTQLHWFAFNALFEGMPEDSSTKQRIAYRSVNLGAIKDKKERARLAKIQRAVAIPRPPMTAEEVGNLFG